MLRDLEDLVAFDRIVGQGSLSGAARELGVSLAVVSRRLARLEASLGVRLVNRTTRALALTDEGQRFHARSVRILADIEEAEREAARGRQLASGVLRVTTTVAFGRRRIAPLLRDFAARHPDLQVQLHASDTLADIVEEGHDLAIRFGALPDSSLMARLLAPNRRVICASPTYLDQRGRPRVLEDLLCHEAVLFGEPALDTWKFADGRSVKMRHRLASNDGEMAHGWALDGAGLVLKSIWDVHEDIAAGRLEIVLPHLALPAAPIHAVYPPGRHMAMRVRFCVDFLAHRLDEEAGAVFADLPVLA